MYLYVVAHQLLYEEYEIQQGPFKGLQNGIENPTKFFEELSWAYRREHKPEEPTDPVQRQGYISEKHRILFCSKLDGNGDRLYSRFPAATEEDWEALRKAFTAAFQLFR